MSLFRKKFIKLSAPTLPVWAIGTVLGISGLLGHFASIPFLTPNQFWLVAAGFVALCLSTLMKGI